MEGGDPKRLPEIRLQLAEFARAMNAVNQTLTRLQLDLATLSAIIVKLAELQVRVGDRLDIITKIGEVQLPSIWNKIRSLNP